MIWSEALTMRSRLREVLKHFIIAQTAEDQQHLLEKCQVGVGRRLGEEN